MASSLQDGLKDGCQIHLSDMIKFILTILLMHALSISRYLIEIILLLLRSWHGWWLHERPLARVEWVRATISIAVMMGTLVTRFLVVSFFALIFMRPLHY